MKQFKRIAAAVLACVLSLTLLAACGSPAAAVTGEMLEKSFLEGMNEGRAEGSAQLVNDPALRATAAAALEKIDANGRIARADVSSDEHAAQDYLVVTADAAADENGKLQARAFTLTELQEFVKAFANDEDANADSYAAIGIATKEVDGKFYVAIGYKHTDDYKEPAQKN